MRLKRVNEVFQNIKFIKLSAMENVFAESIRLIRKKELQYLWKAALCRTFTSEQSPFRKLATVAVSTMVKILSDSVCAFLKRTFAKPMKPWGSEFITSTLQIASILFLLDMFISLILGFYKHFIIIMSTC